MARGEGRKDKKTGGGEEEHKSEGAGGLRWLLTYADMITLLLATFVILAAVSTVQEEKFAIIAAQAKRVFGGGGQVVFQGNQGILPGLPPQKKSAAEGAAGGLKGQQGVALEITTKGIHITMESEILFGSGESALKDKAKVALGRVAKIIESYPGRSVLVEGHTDNVPINTLQFPSNWELSTARASSVIRYFIDKWNINPKRLFASGYGEYKPAPSAELNATPDQRQKNRRVEIWILTHPPQ